MSDSCLSVVRTFFFSYVFFRFSEVCQRLKRRTSSQDLLRENFGFLFKCVALCFLFYVRSCLRIFDFASLDYIYRVRTLVPFRYRVCVFVSFLVL